MCINVHCCISDDLGSISPVMLLTRPCPQSQGEYAVTYAGCERLQGTISDIFSTSLTICGRCRAKLAQFFPYPPQEHPDLPVSAQQPMLRPADYDYREHGNELDCPC